MRGAYCLIDENVKIGRGTKIGDYVELRSGTVIGDDCYIDSRVTCTGNAIIGDNVTVRNAVVIARKCLIGDGTFISPQVMFENVRPATGEQIGGAIIGKNVVIGTGSTIAAGIHICDGAKVGSMSYVTKHILEPGVYMGIPARRVR